MLSSGIQKGKEKLMCLICIDFQLQKMTITDARRAFHEMRTTPAITPEHAREIKEMLRRAEFEVEASRGEGTGRGTREETREN
jgi:hypothetical protein